MYEEDDNNDYLNNLNYNETRRDFDDSLDRDDTQYDALKNNGRGGRIQNQKENIFSKSKNNSPSNSKPKSIGNPGEGTSNEKKQKTFKLTLNQTLPKPTDITDEDKHYLLPKIKNQNQKLKSQVQGLLDLLEQNSLNFYTKKNEKYRPEKYQPDDSLKQRDKLLYDKLSQIRYYQREIKTLRKQLQDSYNVDRLIELENEIKNRQNRIKELKDEEITLKRVEHEQ